MSGGRRFCLVWSMVEFGKALSAQVGYPSVLVRCGSILYCSLGQGEADGQVKSRGLRSGVVWTGRVKFGF